MPRVDKDELVCIWIQIWFEFKCATTYLYPLTRIRHVLHCFKRERDVGRALNFSMRKKGVWGSFLHEVKVQNLSREKKTKRNKSGRRVFLCTLGFWLRVREERTWATSVVSTPNFRESIINLSTTFADNLEHLRSQQTSIEGVRSTSAIKKVQSRTSIR